MSIARRAVRGWRARRSSRWLRAAGVSTNGRVVCHGRPVISRIAESTILVGDGVVLTSVATHNAIGVSQPVVLSTISASARLVIGAESGLSGCSISAVRSIIIGERVLIGSGVILTDSDHHPVDGDPCKRRWGGVPEPAEGDAVVIEDDVFIGARSIILKGVTIGRGSVVGAGSIVTTSIPEGTLAAGNPARVIRRLGS